MSWYEWPVNYSNNSGINGFGDFIVYISGQTNDWLSVGFLFLIWIVTFGVGMTGGSRKAILTSSFITFLFSVYFLRLGILNPVITIFLIVLTIVGAIASKEEQGY